MTPNQGEIFRGGNMNWIKVANFLGAFGKTRLWLQGKKTYITSAIKALTALSAMLATLGTACGVLAQVLTQALGWIDGSMSFGQMSDAVTALVQQHTVLVATFTASFWALADSFSDMAKYAAANRRQAVVEAKICEPDKPGKTV